MVCLSTYSIYIFKELRDIKIWGVATQECIIGAYKHIPVCAAEIEHDHFMDFTMQKATHPQSAMG